MIGASSENSLVEQLLHVARDPQFRQLVYEHLGEYCHNCRNRLNSLKLGLFLAMKQATGPRSEAWRPIEGCYQELERTVELLQAICRPIILSPVTLELDLLIEDRRQEWARILEDKGCTLTCVAPSGQATATFDVDRMGQALDSMVRWRAGDYGSNRSARLRWWVDSKSAHISWQETNPSPVKPPEDIPTWHLPLLARLITAHGGEYRMVEGPDWHLDLSWPASELDRGEREGR